MFQAFGCAVIVLIRLGALVYNTVSRTLFGVLSFDLNIVEVISLVIFAFMWIGVFTMSPFIKFDH